MDLEHPFLGRLRAEARKTYSARPSRMVASLATCPLTLRREGGVVGRAKVAYRDSILAYPFRAIRLVHEARAFGASA